MLNRFQLAFLGAAVFLQRAAHPLSRQKPRIRVRKTPPLSKSTQLFSGIERFWRLSGTPGAQSATVHPTRSFAIMHAAIYDAVNAIDRKHRPYLVRLSGVPRDASQEAAAAAAAHEVLVALYPAFKTTLDAQLQQSLAQIPDGNGKAEGILIGQSVADRILAARSNDGSNAPPIPYVFGTAPGDYQSTPPNFAPQPQFTNWSHVTPFALERANQFRPGPPPTLASDAYGDCIRPDQIPWNRQQHDRDGR